jgi:hypothetical protein
MTSATEHMFVRVSEGRLRMHAIELTLHRALGGIDRGRALHRDDCSSATSTSSAEPRCLAPDCQRVLSAAPPLYQDGHS